MSPLLGWSLRASATIALGLLLALALRRRSAATRSLVLRATLASVLALPLAAAFAPRVEVPLTSPLPPSGSSWGKGQGGGGSTGATLASSGWSVEPSPEKGAPSALVQRTPLRNVELPVGSLLFALWLGGSGLFVLRLLAGVARLVGLRRRATPTDAPDVWRAALSVPATYGRTILLPLESDAWPEARRRAAILHERAHVARHDWHWQVLATLFAAIHWPNPLAWWLLRSLRDAAEAAADDAALAHMAPSEYARELLAVAKNAGRVGPALAMARRGGVRDRVVAVLAPRDRRGPSTRLASLLLATVLGVGFAVAALTGDRDQADRAAQRMPDGTRVEIVSLRDFGPDAQSEWRPDGTPLQFVSASTMPRSNWRSPATGMRRVLADVQVSDLPTSDTPSAVPDARVQEQIVPGSPRRGTWLRRFFWDVPQGKANQDVRLAMATGAWKDYRGSAISFTAGRKQVRYTGGSADDAFVTFPVPKPLLGRNLRLVALGEAGVLSHVDERGFDPNLIGVTAQTMTLRLPATDPKAIRHVRLQYRDYDTVTFPAVALRPTLPVAAQGVRLLDVREIAPRPSLRWDAQGRAVATPKGVEAGFFVPGKADLEPGERVLHVRFATPAPPERGGIALRPIDPGVWAPYFVSTESGSTVAGATVYSLKKRTRESFRVGVLTGVWTPLPISTTGFVVRPLPKAPWVRFLDVSWPADSDPRPGAPDEVAFKLEIRDAQGRPIDWSGLKYRPADGKRVASFALVGKRTPARIALWTRPYAWTTIPDVPLVRPTP